MERKRRLKGNLTRKKVKFVIAGNVRSDNSNPPKFREKGVDVRIAVDMISSACDSSYDTLILCSSDSDL